MSAERQPEPPHVPESLAARPETTIADGDELDSCEVIGLAGADRTLAAVQAVEVVFREPDLSGAVLADCELRDVVFENARLANATIRGGTLSRLLVDGGRLTGIQVAEAGVRDALWRGCGADMASFRRSRLERVTFEGCSLRDADFTGLQGVGVRFHDCDLRGATFQHAELSRCELRRCRLEEVEGIEGLRGTAMELDQLVALAPTMARALGIALIDV